MNKVLCRFILLLVSLPLPNAGMAEEPTLIDKDSPITWRALLTGKWGKKVLIGQELNPLLTDGLVNKELDVSCKFKLDKEFSKVLKTRVYNERIWIECDVKGVKVTMDAIGCTSGPRKSGFDLSDSQGIYFNLWQSVKFFCNPIQ